MILLSFSFDTLPFSVFLLFPIIILAAVVIVQNVKIKRMLNSIEKITETAEKIKTGEIDVQKDLNSYFEVDGSEGVEFSLLKAALKDTLEEIAAGFENAIRNRMLKIGNERLQLTSFAQTNFFSNMSHQIKTPMNSILGIAQILLYDDNLTETQIKYVEEIKDSSDTLLSIINDILDLSRLETDKLTLAKTDFDFKDMLEEIVADNRFIAAKKKLQFNYITSGDIPECIYDDENRIRQIITNLLNNAIKYTEKGEITFKVSVDDNITFVIEDTGIGIEAEKLEDIFKPFEQMESTPNGIIAVGLGLAIVKKLCDIMDAKITVVSMVEKGSVFTVILPKTLGNIDNLPENHRKSKFVARQAKILIVDDNEINLYVASGLIETLFKADCDLAFSGKEALEKVKSNDYDLIFMDHMMPEMDGIETTVAIRELGGKYEELPIVALTANSVIGTKDILIKGGMSDFISKPLQQEELQRILAKWLPADKINLSLNEQLLQADNETPKSQFVSRLAEIRGLDISQALNNVANREDILENSLKILLSKIPSQIVELQKYLDAKELKPFSLLTHTIKGSFSNCGFVLISKLAAKLSRESEIENYLYCRDNLQFFIEKLTILETELSHIFVVSDDISERKTATETELAEYACVLRIAIENYDYQIIKKTVDELIKLNFGKESNEKIANVFSAVSCFDYNAAKKLIYSL